MKRPELRIVECTQPAGLQVAEAHWSDRRTDEPLDWMPDRGQQAADDVLAAFVQGEIDPLAQPPRRLATGRGRHCRQIRLDDLEGRVHQPMGELSVVRQYEQSLA